jgi:hypothetical protein
VVGAAAAGGAAYAVTHNSSSANPTVVTQPTTVSAGSGQVGPPR